MEFHLNQVEHGQRPAADFMAEIESYTREIVEHAKNFEDILCGLSRSAVRRCRPSSRPCSIAARRSRARSGCPLRIWKDTSGRYIDRNARTP
jgi:hypothetical protein